ncbi:unnamed protein product [Photorhabdus laumondii subsp. laumondii TTO1]|uniref:Photorhabdus luminescens subsp. laumondii TTO1 complete genome segment 16/17 n=4 Tax=Photorhabdus TaxID=29487 RepID=Q7MAY2_PHOLL|nr:unnamed protein product [Photorhabdus laumondii subsp. laumondii TTO1]
MVGYQLHRSRHEHHTMDLVIKNRPAYHTSSMRNSNGPLWNKWVYMNNKYETVIVLGAGPIGLFSAFKILENNFAENVLILDKRFISAYTFKGWAERSMVVQFHRKLFSLSYLPKIVKKCPYGVLKEDYEDNRKKYSDLDHMSIKNIQSTILENMEKFYKNRFFMVGLKDMSFDKDIVSISIFTEHFDDNSILKNLNPELIVDATGYHSILMNKTIGIQFESEHEYGSALKMTWPEHEMSHVENKKTEFHDCHENTIFFSEGNSSVAEFSYPSDKFSEFFEECGYSINHRSTKLPFLKFDTTPFSIKLPPFLEKITSLKKDHFLYKRAVDLFNMIRRNKLSGINGLEFINHLQGFNWSEADSLALVVRRIINKRVTIENTYANLEENFLDLMKIRVIFIPSRAERWLSTNKVTTKINLIFSNDNNSLHNQISSVTACAVGDSLASTDFRHGLGINRGFHTATRLFQDKTDPELVRLELIQNSYSMLDVINDNSIFSRAISCRDWLIL